MKRAQWIAIGALVLFGSGVAYLALRNRQPPVLPADETHAEFESAAACLVCHGPPGVLPQGPNHPLGADCLRCHGRP